MRIERIYFPLALFAMLLLSACGAGDGPVMTAIASTQSAAATQAVFNQQQTQSAMANMQLTQSAQELSLQMTQAAMQQTQAALSVQEQVQASIAQTQAAQALAATATPQPGTLVDGTPIPGVNPLSSTGVSFTGARVYSQANLGNRNYMVSIQLSDEVKEISGSYFLEVAGKKFKCSVIKDYPNRLYCNGQSPRGGYHAVRLYEDVGGLARLVFVSDVTLPVWTPTRPPRGGKPSPTPIYSQ